AIAAREMVEEAGRVLGLRERLRAQIQSAVEDASLNGSLDHRLPGNLNVTFPGVDAAALLLSMPDVALSTGSACSSATPEPSHVLRAIGLSDRLSHSSLRFGLGRFNTEEEVDYVAGRVIESVRKLRALSPVYEMAKEGVDLSQVAWVAEPTH